MDAYRHITPIERGRIMTLFNQGHRPAAIATELNRHMKHHLARTQAQPRWRKLQRRQGAGKIRQQAPGLSPQAQAR